MCPHLPTTYRKWVGEAVETDRREIEMLQSNREVADTERRHVKRLDKEQPAALLVTVIIALRHRSGEDRQTLAPRDRVG